MEDKKKIYMKQAGAAEAGGNFYEMKLVMLFLLRGSVAVVNRQIDSFRLAANLDLAHPFDDIVFLQTSRGSSQLILLQAKCKKDPKKNTIVWDTLFNSKNKDFSVKKYMEGVMDMDLEEDEMLRGPFHRKEYILYTNAPLKKSDKSSMEETEANVIYRAKGRQVTKVCFNDDVYESLKLNSDFTMLVDELVKSIESKEFKPEIPIYQKYRNHLQEFVVGFNMTDGGVDPDLFSPNFITCSGPPEILVLKEALFAKVKSKSKSEDELMARLKETKVRIKKGHAGTQNTKAKQALVQYATQDEVREFLDNFFIACNQPGEVDLEDIIKREIAIEYRIYEKDAEIMYNDVYVKIQSWWKDENYYLTEKDNWFDTARENLSEPSLVYAVDLMKTKMKNLGIAYNSFEELESSVKTKKMINVVCDRSVSILNCVKVYQALENYFPKNYYIFLEQESFKKVYCKVLEAFEGNCDLLVVNSYELISDELVRIVRKSPNKRIIWIGSAQSKFSSIVLKIGFKDLAELSQENILNNCQILLQGEIVTLKDLVVRSSANDTITDDLLADLVNDGITEIGRPLEGLGELDSFHIPRKLKRSGHTEEYKPEDIGPDPGNMFVLVSAPPGMGKSTLISSFMGEKFHWKYRINLREHSALLNNRQNIEALDFLKEANRMSEAEFRLFKVAYESCGNIALYFDGFDEIAPDYKQIVLRLFKSLRNSKINEVWVTTRPGFEEELEKQLNTVAYKLEPFSIDNQKDFLKKIWITSNDAEVDDYLNKFSRAIKDSVNFTGVPLHLKMISEMRNESIFNEDLNMFSIYDRFFYNKFYQMAMREKANMDINILMVKNIVDERYASIKSKHEMLAILALFEKSNISKLISIDEINVFETSMISEIGQGNEKSGVVYSVINDRPVFVHRTFAEFFAASWLIIYYIKYKNTKDFSKIKIYKNIYNPENNVLRLFFDFALCKDSEACRAVLTRDLDKLNNMTSTALNTKDLAGRTAFHLAKAYEYDDIVEILSKKWAGNYSSDQLFKYNPTQYEYFKRFSVWDSIQIYLDYKRPNEESQNEFSVNVKNRLHWAAANGNIDQTKELIESGVDVNAKDKNMLTPLHLAAANGHIEIMELLIKSGSRLNERDVSGTTPLLAASIFEKDEAIKILTINGADLNIGENYGFTPSHREAINGNNRNMKLFVDHGVNLNLKAGDGWTPLYIAAQIGHSELVQTMVESGANPNETEGTLRTPLHVAVQNDHDDIALFLLDHGVDMDAKNNLGSSPLGIAAQNGHNAIAKILIQRGVDVNSRSIFDNTPLHTSAQNGHAHVAQTLIDNGADITAKNKNGSNPLHTAAQNGHSEVAKILIDKGCDMNAKNNRNLCPLHEATAFGHSGAVQVLIDYGADLNMTANEGITPLMIAAGKGHSDIVRMLIDGGADLNAINDSGFTPLHGAAKNGHVDIVQCLIDQGADLNRGDTNNWTALHLAALNNHQEVVQALADHGAILDATTNKGRIVLYNSVKKGQILLGSGVEQERGEENGWTAFHLAAQNGHHEIVETLIDHGADPNATTTTGDSPLCIAARNGRDNVVQILIENGVEPNTAEKDGWTALQWAAQNNHHEVARTLIDNGADLNAANAKGDTAASIAAIKGHHALVQYLIDHGAMVEMHQSS